MIHELYKKAAVLHGHSCPGLAIGVRAAAEALRILGAERGGRGLYCIAESRACYQDGIQMAFGTTLGNGDLELRDRGKTAFNFYDRGKGSSVRLVLKSQPEGLSREEMTEYILTAPAEDVFSRTETRFAAPADRFTRRKNFVCPRCGEQCREPFLRVFEGEIVCLDCAEAQAQA